ncbi:MAG: MFS transporter [Longibaculum muris]|uniref:PPP family 3-phenylpropionic acid transporter n=1 Tax=Longibaculum muris TaxID=1796628 RepID=A0A4V2W5T3_9FIRM|nr:MFS transporter [Longibaculum muris]MBS5370008.1 MFS transporter [Coprobacillus cateniformis]MCR1886520.1 MFS transporter [Longibaculum muris]MED9811445.1 MFS transporter [Longibaculum muris]TCW01572.1 PPP family 3-phenylpropionic acid transporter [Longibaculum muris]
MENKSLDIRYACIHGFYWMLCCSMIGYASVFLLDKGFTNTTIGTVLAISNILAVFGQPAVASYMDKTSKLSLRMLISLILVVIIALSLVLCFLTGASMVMVVLTIVAFTLMLTLQPFINSLTFAFEKNGIHINFGLARGIGSVAYAVMSLILGNLVAAFSPELLPFFYVGLSLCALFFVYTFFLPGHKDEIVHQEKETEHDQLSMGQFIKKYKTFMLLLVATVLLFFDHSVINNFFIQVVNHINGNSADMGNAIFLAAVLELPTMALFTKFQQKIGCKNMMLISAVFFSVKHVLTYFAVNMFMIYVAQVMQMLAYAVFIPASVYYVSQLVEEHDMNKGQALVTGAMTLASVFASLAGGVLLDALGVSKVLMIGAIISVLGTICMFISVEDVDQHAKKES